MRLTAGAKRALQGMRGLSAHCQPKIFWERAFGSWAAVSRRSQASLIESVVALGYGLQAIPPARALVPLATAADVVQYQGSLGHPQVPVDLFGRLGDG